MNQDWYMAPIAKFERVPRHKWHRSNKVPVIFEICLKDDSKCINYSLKAVRLSYLQVFMQWSTHLRVCLNLSLLQSQKHYSIYKSKRKRLEEVFNGNL